MLGARTVSDEDASNWPAMADLALVTALLMTFFLIVQVAISAERTAIQLEVERNQKEVGEFVLNATNQASLTDSEDSQATEVLDGNLDEACTRHSSILTICIDGNLQRFRFSDRVLFDVAEAELKDEGRSILTVVGQQLLEHQDLFSRVSIEGHTDNVPIRSRQFDSNWELSSARATSVLRLLEGLEFPRHLLSATGYGEHQPLARGNTAAARSRNRRVELAVVYSSNAVLARLNNLGQDTAESAKPALPEIEAKSWTTQFISGPSLHSATEIRDELIALDQPAYIFRRAGGDHVLYAVRIGSFDERSEAETAISTLESLGYAGATVRVFESPEEGDE